MSMQIKIPGADFSGLGFPRVKRRVAGFDVETAFGDLQALYLFEDGDDGAAIVTAVDSSGHDRHASLVAGSVAPVKAAAGAHKPAGLGSYLYNLPGVAFGSAFSMVGVYRCAIVPASGINAYPELWKPSANLSGGSLANTQSAGEFINGDLASNSNVAGTGNVGWLASTGYMTAALTAGGIRQGVNVPGATRNDWIAWAASYDPEADHYRVAVAESEFSLVSPVASALTKAKTGTHLFGMGLYHTNLPNMPGDVGLFGLYAGAMDIAGLKDLIARARLRMLRREISVF